MLFLTCICTVSAFSQVTTSAINGTVTDENGEGLPGANVVAIHVLSGTQYGTSTRPDGKFNLPNLRVGGPYTVTATFIGYQEQSIDFIYLDLGQNLAVKFEMQEEATQLGEVVVTAEGDVINSDRTGAGTNIDNERLTALPTISRSAADIYRLSPQSDGNSFGGRNDQYNNFSLDGSIFNNPFGLDAATPGGQTDAQPISLDAIDQIQVSVAPYDVTQSGFTGAAVNAVTKSGTNKFSGTVFGFFRNQDMTGSKVSGREIVVPDLRQFQTGFSLGGPIIKNKLFFFANAEIERREDLGSNFIAAGAGASGENVSRVLASDLMAVSDALRGLGYETGAYEGYTHDSNNEKGIFKLDWNMSNNHSLTATYNFLNATKDKPAHPSAIGRRGPDQITLQFENSGYTINNKIQSGILELRSRFGNKFSNKLQVGYTSFRDSRDPFSSPFPVVNINRDGIRYIVAGHEPFSINNVLDQDVIQFTNNFDIYTGNHTFTVGTSLERFDFNNSFNLDGYGGTFGPGFESTQAFLDAVENGDFSTAVADATATFDNNNANDSWALAETNVGQWALYGQDRWAVNDQLTLTLGIRMDLPLYFDTDEKIQENIDRNCCYDPSITYFDEDGTPIKFDHTVLPEQKPLFSPRVGFNLDVTGDQTKQLRGGTGLFTGRFPFVWIGNQVANPNFFFYNVTHPDFEFPQVWRTNLGYDQKLDNNWSFTADVIYTKDINAMMVRNYGINLPTGSLLGVDQRPVYSSDEKAPNNAYVFTNSDKGNSFNFTLQGRKKWEAGWAGTLSYNYLNSKDVSSIEAEISSDAYDRNPAFGHVNADVLSNSLYGNRHRILGTLGKKFEYGGHWGTTISVVAEYAEGGRFSYTYSGDINGDGSGLNDLIYIPTDGEIDQMDFDDTQTGVTAQRNALRAFIAQDDYLSENRGEYVEKYSILSPWYSRWDLRILQDLYLNEKKNTLQLSIDILNVGNLVSSDWGVRQLPQNTQPIGVSVSEDAFNGNFTPTYSFDTSLTETFTDDFSLLSRWQLQVGLRFSF